MGILKLLCCYAVACALAVGVTACGGGDETTATKTTSASKGWTGPVPSALADVGGRLKDAGYEPGGSSDRTRGATVLIRVLMHEGGAVFVSTRPKDIDVKNLAAQVKQSRGRYAADLVGSDLFVASTGLNLLDAKKPLSDAQLAEFQKILAAGKG